MQKYTYQSTPVLHERFKRMADFACSRHEAIIIMSVVSSVPHKKERIFRGIGVSPGVVRGRIVVMDHDHNEEPARRHIPTDKHSAELDRLQSALAETRREISEIQRQVQNNLGASESAIFDAHLLVLEDSTLIGEVKRFVETENVNVDYAFHSVAEKYAHALGTVEDEYLRERAADSLVQAPSQAVTAAALALGGGRLTLTSALTFTVCLGIAVDDTIHFLARLQEELQNSFRLKRAELLVEFVVVEFHEFIENALLSLVGKLDVSG